MPRRSCDVGVKVRFFRDAWWVVVHHQGRRRRKRIGPDKKLAERVASEIRAKLVLGHFEMHRKVAATVPFSRFARDWLRREVELPIDRGLEGHLAPGTATIYRLQIDVHLVPFFGEADIRAVGLRDIQAFYDHCIDTGRPRSAKSIDMALNVLRQILSHARAQGLIGTNPVEEWKRGRPRRRASSSMTVSAARILSADELNRVLAVAAARASRFYPLILFLADTGCRLGEAFALRWSDLDLEGATARIARSFSSGEHLGPTKTGRERVVELSTRLCRALAECMPAVFPIPDGCLVFPNTTGGFLFDKYFREKIFRRVVRDALGAGRRHTPHDLRHTWASLHMARGTPLKWIQAQGGWTTAKMLLDTYGHFMPTESRGFADRITAPDGPQTAPRSEAPKTMSGGVAESRALSGGSDEIALGDRPEVPNHALHRSAALLQKLGDIHDDRGHAAFTHPREKAIRYTSRHHKE